MSKTTLPRTANGHGYCWSEKAGIHLHCTLPRGHEGKHWHAYTRTSW